MNIGMLDLHDGASYRCGTFTRKIEKIFDGYVYYSDDVGAGHCTKRVFLKKCLGFAGEKQPPDKTPFRYQTQKNLIEIAAALAALQNHHNTIAKIVSPLEWRLLESDRHDLRQALSESSDLLVHHRDAIEGNLSR